MQEYVQKSTSTTLPRSCCNVSGFELIQVEMPVKRARRRSRRACPRLDWALKREGPRCWSFASSSRATALRSASLERVRVVREPGLQLRVDVEGERERGQRQHDAEAAYRSA